jgi:hypothetical protein
LRVDDSGDLTYAISQNLRFLARQVEVNERAPVHEPVRSRAVVWAGRRRIAAMVGLCVVVPGLVIAATGNTNIAIVWTELGLFASPVPFFVGAERLAVSIWLCGVAALYVLGSAILELLSLFVASVGAALALGSLVAGLAGEVALVGCVWSGGSLLKLVGLESIAVVGLGGALVLIGSDSSGLHHVEGGAATEQFVSDDSYLYTWWATGGVMILTGIGVAIFQSKRQRHKLTPTAT